MVAFAVVVALVALVVLYVVFLQRSLVHLDELRANAMSQIGVQMNSRWDGLTALADVMKGYAEHERTALREIIAQRAPLGRTASAEEIQQQEGLLASALGRLIAVSENYPELKANTLYQTTMENIAAAEDKVRMSRMVYNDTVTRINRAVRMFPASLFASMLGFGPHEYLKEPDGKTEMPSMRDGGR